MQTFLKLTFHATKKSTICGFFFQAVRTSVANIEHGSGSVALIQDHQNKILINNWISFWRRLLNKQKYRINFDRCKSIVYWCTLHDYFCRDGTILSLTYHMSMSRWSVSLVVIVERASVIKHNIWSTPEHTRVRGRSGSSARSAILSYPILSYPILSRAKISSFWD